MRKCRVRETAVQGVLRIVMAKVFELPRGCVKALNTDNIMPQELPKSLGSTSDGLLLAVCTTDHGLA
eukprot:5535399-Pyramimonas_sp.AAC.1